MRIYKSNSSSFWYYEFVLNGTRHQKSTRMKNEREALKVANAAFTALVKGEAGIGEPKSVPTLREFREDFITAVRAEKQDKPMTVQFYTYSAISTQPLLLATPPPIWPIDFAGRPRNIANLACHWSSNC
jgi:hypothetical protein